MRIFENSIKKCLALSLAAFIVGCAQQSPGILSDNTSINKVSENQDFKKNFKLKAASSKVITSFQEIAIAPMEVQIIEETSKLLDQNYRTILNVSETKQVTGNQKEQLYVIDEEQKFQDLNGNEYIEREKVVESIPRIFRFNHCDGYWLYREIDSINMSNERLMPIIRLRESLASYASDGNACIVNGSYQANYIAYKNVWDSTREDGKEDFMVWPIYDFGTCGNKFRYKLKPMDELETVEKQMDFKRWYQTLADLQANANADQPFKEDCSSQASVVAFKNAFNEGKDKGYLEVEYPEDLIAEGGLGSVVN